MDFESRMMDAPSDYYAQPVEHHFQPYTDNGGTVVAIAGKNYVVIASETRLSEGFQIQTRNQSKLFKLNKSTVLGVTGCWCDVLSFVKILEAKVKIYSWDHDAPMSTKAVAQQISTMLYGKRFFPYYISNIVAGLDEDGAGAVYSYDPVGHFDRAQYRAGGSSASLIQPFLDSQVGLKNQANPTKVDLSIDQAKRIVKDAFISAAERDIYVGDSICLQVITKEGISEESFPLRRD